MAAASAHQVSLSLNYEKDKSQLALVPTNDPVLSKEPQICKTRYYIQEDGLYNPGDNWQYFVTDSKSILSHDGISGWLADFPKSYNNENGYGPNEHLCVSKGKGVDYGFAAGFGNVTIKEETNHSSNTEQCDYWGTATRNDSLSGKKDGVHYAWGSNKKAGNNPHVFYNY